MSQQWYVRSGQKEHGPFSSSQLKKLAEQERITPETSIRRGDVFTWIPASKVKGLFEVRTTSTHEVESQAESHSEQEDQPDDGNYPDSPLSHPQVVIQVDASTALSPHLTRRSSSTRRPHFSLLVLGSLCILALLTISVVVYFAYPEDESFTTEQLVARSEASVALIKGKHSTGTGFLIQKNMLATNRHVIEGELPRHLSVQFPSAPEDKRGPYSVELLYIDDAIDFALLKLDAPLPPLSCADEYTFRRGQDIIVIGNPGVSDEVLLQNAVSRGVMSTQTVIDGQQYNQLGISINSGNSGGPVFDQSGTVVGVVTLKASDKEGLGFSIPIQAVNDALGRANAMSNQDIAKTQAMHRARVVYKYVNLSGNVYKLAMDAYTKAMATSIEAGLGPDTGLTTARSQIESQIAAFDDVLIGDLKKEISSISTDSSIPDSTRQRLVDFWTNYLELKSYVDNPRGNYNSYSSKYRELSDARDRLAESVKLLVGASD